MAQLMAENDLCIGGAGGTSWERCALGMPAILLILAANQHMGAIALQSHGAALLANDTRQLISHMTDMLNPDKQISNLRKMSHYAAKLTTGDGASKVVELLLATHD